MQVAYDEDRFSAWRTPLMSVQRNAISESYERARLRSLMMWTVDMRRM